jgi:transglutaminase-like putative cysteine protease
LRSVLIALGAALLALPSFGLERTFDAVYTATIRDVPAGIKQLKVWVPIPTSRGWQKVSEVQMSSPYVWIHKTDPDFGNRYAFTTIDNPPAGEVTVRVRFKASRGEAQIDAPADTTASRTALKRSLRGDKLVTLSPRVRQLAAQITDGKKGVMEQARAIYDYVVTTIKYDKTIPGWGEGNTERACDIKAGNCTDFHSLFLSLARAKEIPARFVIGFPLTAADGNAGGYHCWAEFYVKGKGWIPVDASDASKVSDQAKRDYLFGNLDADRIEFTIGRDIVLDPRPAEPLNYFIYPYAEADGKPVGTPSIALQFRELSRSVGASE